jgi:hypothetical protein
MRVVLPLVVISLMGAAGAAPRTPAERIPNEYYGQWCYEPEQQTFARGPCADPDSDRYLTIRATEMDAHETSCRLISTSRNNKDFVGRFACAGEGKKWIETYLFRINGGRLHMSSLDPGGRP